MSQHRTSYQQCVHFQVQIGFKDTSRKTILKGHNKLACRAIVMKQYKTAVNHLMEIETVKKDVADTLKKSIKPHLIEKTYLNYLCFHTSSVKIILKLKQSSPLTR